MTYFRSCKYDIDHMDITPALRENVSLKMYEAGHMMYINETAMGEFKQDLAKFVRDSH